MKILKSLLFIFVVSLLSACVVDDDGVSEPNFPEINRGSAEVNRIILTFTDKGNTSDVRSFEYYNPNGGTPTVNELITLEYPRSGIKTYDLEIALFKDQEEQTSIINSLDDKYIICYRDNTDANFRIGESNKDRNGVALGTDLDINTLDDTDRDGELRITLNFQDAGKEGLCDPGVRIFEGTMNYLLN